jgi:drug/metabolite transporter (DMT)-like permease
VAVLLGLTGALIIVEPGTAEIDPMHLLPLAAALCYAFVQILSRELGKENSSVAITLYGSLGLAIPLLLGTSASWIIPSPGETCALAAVAIAGGLSSLFYVAACRRAPLPVLAPIDYLSLIWAGTWGYLIWAEIPKNSLWLGGTLIVTAFALSSRAAFVCLAERPAAPPAAVASPPSGVGTDRADWSNRA